MSAHINVSGQNINFGDPDNGSNENSIDIVNHVNLTLVPRFSALNGWSITKDAHARSIQHTLGAYSYTWIASTNEIAFNDMYPYISRQQDHCWVAPVVECKMLRTKTNPTYYFFGDVSNHNYVVGETYDHSDSFVSELVNFPTTTSFGSLDISGSTDTVSINLQTGYSTRPLVMVDKTNGDVGTIENSTGYADIIGEQFVYVQYVGANDTATSWIFSNYGSDGGWYRFSDSSAVGQTYGTPEFWSFVQANPTGLTRVLQNVANQGWGNDSNFTSSVMEVQATINGDVLKMHYFSDANVVQNQLFNVTNNRTLHC